MGRGSSKAGGGNGGNVNKDALRKSEDYKDEINMQLSDMPYGGFFEGVNDDTVETQMRGYKSAYSVSLIDAYQKQQNSVKRQKAAYDNAESLSQSNMAQQLAMEDIIKDCDNLISRMKKIKLKNKKSSML